MRVWFCLLCATACWMLAGSNPAPARITPRISAGYGGAGGYEAPDSGPAVDAALDFEHEARLFLEEACGLCDAADCCGEEYD